MVKKKLNIPIGDVDIDEDYEKNVTANFTLPPNLIRHTRRVGDEEDLLLDFIMDSEDERWLKSHPRFQGDKEIAELLTPDTFEVFINLFEKLTGMQDNYVTLVS